MNLVLWTLALTPEHYGLLRSLRRLGYAGVEVTITPGNGENFAEVRRVLDGEGLERTVLTNLGPHANPVDPDSQVRQRALDTLRWVIDTGAELGSPMVSGPLYAAANTFTGTAATEAELERSADVLRAACHHAAASGTTLCLEFMSRFETYLVNTTAQAARLAGQVGAENLGLVYDTHHAHLEENDIRAALVGAGDRVRHVHLSESHRGTLGSGLLDWGATVRALKTIGYDGWLMIETFGTDVTELARKAHVWRNTFASKDEVAAGGIVFARRLWADDQATPGKERHRA